MATRHRVALAALVGLAALWGLVALARTASPPRPAAAHLELATRERALDRAEAALRRLASRRPPPLPPLPPAPAGGAAPTPAPVAAPRRIVVVRAQPVIAARHADEGRDGGEE